MIKFSDSPTGPGSRRGFLRSLVSLPMLGGGLGLIGAPSAVAVPIDEALRQRYVAFLAHEHAAALAEYEFMRHIQVDYPGLGDRDAYISRVPMHWFPDAPDIERAVAAAPPSQRAALVLGVAGLACRPRVGETHHAQ